MEETPSPHSFGGGTGLCGGSFGKSYGGPRGDGGKKVGAVDPDSTSYTTRGSLKLYLLVLLL